MASSSSSSSSSNSNKSVLFVDLRNICFSPIAEAVFRRLVATRGVAADWTVDSCGIIDLHAGQNPEPRARKVLRDRGLAEYKHKARVIRNDDLAKFDYILGLEMDDVSELKYMKFIQEQRTQVRIHLLGEFNQNNVHFEGELKEARDPFHENDDRSFYACYDLCLDACKGFLDNLEKADKEAKQSKKPDNSEKPTKPDQKAKQ
ncbi:low molecular weight phosphotyrosine protein phosphatase [Folsomia candida]|uniref:Low molecular weight phosphotyrosine protein phosphatase n=1 Tax=Folsomia candida TaxID=158441 RepID=A0A226D0S9_FOLCA|nr:low molecular weight phosphotyrosine protein phosphatase [Folsomia candida]OXA38464.1 Low molecular weight phosphotyrosine protein phosphatase [Folsomia candida]